MRNYIKSSVNTYLGRSEAKHAKRAPTSEGGLTVPRSEYQNRVISGTQFPHRFPPTMRGRVVLSNGRNQ